MPLGLVGSQAGLAALGVPTEFAVSGSERGYFGWVLDLIQVCEVVLPGAFPTMGLYPPGPGAGGIVLRGWHRWIALLRRCRPDNTGVLVRAYDPRWPGGSTSYR